MTVLGSDIKAGHCGYLIVPGGHWKMSELLSVGGQDYGLISEVVCPGFEYEDRTMATLDDLKALCPDRWQHWTRGINSALS